MTITTAAAAAMTAEQEATARRLCGGARVPFDPAAFRPAFDLPTGYVAGWVGGVFYGIAPDGAASS